MYFGYQHDPDLRPAMRDEPSDGELRFFEKPKHHPERIRRERAARIIQRKWREIMKRRIKSAEKIQKAYRKYRKSRKKPGVSVEVQTETMSTSTDPMEGVEADGAAEPMDQDDITRREGNTIEGDDNKEDAEMQPNDDGNANEQNLSEPNTSNNNDVVDVAVNGNPVITSEDVDPDVAATDGSAAIDDRIVDATHNLNLEKPEEVPDDGNPGDETEPLPTDFRPDEGNEEDQSFFDGLKLFWQQQQKARKEQEQEEEGIEGTAPIAYDEDELKEMSQTQRQQFVKTERPTAQRPDSSTRENKYYDCGHRRLTYDGYLLPDACEWLHLFEARDNDPASLLRWKQALRDIVCPPSLKMRKGAKGGSMSACKHKGPKQHPAMRRNSKARAPGKGPKHSSFEVFNRLAATPVDPKDPNYVAQEKAKMMDYLGALNAGYGGGRANVVGKGGARTGRNDRKINGQQQARRQSEAPRNPKSILRRRSSKRSMQQQAQPQHQQPPQPQLHQPQKLQQQFRTPQPGMPKQRRQRHPTETTTDSSPLLLKRHNKHGMLEQERMNVREAHRNRLQKVQSYPDVTKSQVLTEQQDRMEYDDEDEERTLQNPSFSVKVTRTQRSEPVDWSAALPTSSTNGPQPPAVAVRCPPKRVVRGSSYMDLYRKRNPASIARLPPIADPVRTKPKSPSLRG